MVEKYSAKDIRTLGDIESIRINPSQFVGSLDRPTHLIEEAIDNAIDEALGGSATIIAVFINTKTKVCSVLDNGRGLPISKDVPITVSTKLYSGAKFQDKKTAYKISSGMHGVGLVAVNALTTDYKIEIYRSKKHAIFTFKNTKFKGKKIKAHHGAIPFSTKIEFKPDKKIFDSIDPDLNRIRKRLTIATAEMPKCTFVLTIDDKKEIFDLTLEQYFRKQCFDEKDTPSLISLTSSKKPELFDILMAYATSGSIAPKLISSVNLLPVDHGGSHVSAFYDILKTFYITKGKKYGFKFLPNDTLPFLRAYLKLNLIEPKFSSQTKEKLVSRKNSFDVFVKQLKSQLESYYSKREKELKEQLERFALYRSKLDSKKLKAAKGAKRASTKFTKLRDCTSRKGELFIVEGESAGGSILQCRNPKIHAVFPLKGKIPNISNAKNILKNKEVSEMLQAFGTGVDPDFNIVDLRYEKIVCATDADPDGSHIAALVTMVLAVLVPEIIKQGRYYIAQTPLFAIVEGKSFTPLWDRESLEEAQKNGKNIQRYKGLGEMSPHQMKISLIDNDTRRLQQVKYTEDIVAMGKLFSDSGVKRELLNS